LAAGEGQPLGISPQYGGPYLGILACTDALVRQIPGRLVGLTTDVDGKRAFVMTLQAREQPTRREKAASNICTNQALLALAASIWLAALGPHGLRDVATLGAARAAELERALAEAGAPRAHPGPYLNEFAIRVPDAAAVHRALLEPGVLGGLLLRESVPNEPEVVRHYVNLSQLNYAVDTGFYPLGSCTMKWNPKVNEWAARLPGFATLHPMAPDAVAQGTLQLLWELEQILVEISGMRAVTLQPAAGAHGELTGILMIRAYHEARGDSQRSEVLVPDSAHGTNPATASMAGFRTINVPSAADGGVDLEEFRKALGPRTAAVMITNPSTLGLFESRIGELLAAVR